MHHLSKLNIVYFLSNPGIRLAAPKLNVKRSDLMPKNNKDKSLLFGQFHQARQGNCDEV